MTLPHAGAVEITVSQAYGTLAVWVGVGLVAAGIVTRRRDT